MSVTLLYMAWNTKWLGKKCDVIVFTTTIPIPHSAPQTSIPHPKHLYRTLNTQPRKLEKGYHSTYQ